MRRADQRPFTAASGQPAPHIPLEPASILDLAEHRALQQRKSVLRNDDWLEEYLGFAGREH